MTRKIVWPIVVLLAAAVAMVALVNARPDVEVVEPEVLPPLVRVLEAVPTSERLTVRSQGSVLPRTETELVAEVAGRIVWTSEHFASGGFFAEGDVLVRLDRRDYELAKASAEAQLAQAKVRLERESAEAEIAREEWSELGEGDPSPLVLHEPQMAEARAAVAAAEAVLARAELDLTRTVVRAPFQGRVRAKRADVGRYVGQGAALGTVYAVDYAEVRLPVPGAELAYIDLPGIYRQSTGSGPEVQLSAEFAGRTATWQGRVVRTEGELDPQTRMMHLVARVDDPYGESAEHPDRPPLAVGLFVDAEIGGRVVDGVVRLPRSVLRGDDQLLVVEDGKRLRFRQVEVLRRRIEDVLISAGLEAGEEVCVSRLDAVIDGMPVRVDRGPDVDETPARQRESGADHGSDAD